MNKLRIIAALIKYLYITKAGDKNVRYTVNRKAHGQTWFLVEPAYVFVHEASDQLPLFEDLNRDKYVVVGGGKQHGKLVYVGSSAIEQGIAEGRIPELDREPNI